MVKLYETNSPFVGLQNKIEELISQINLESFKRIRWFQQKALRIKEIQVCDHTQLSSNKKNYLLFPLILNFSLEDRGNNNTFTEKYYVPLLINKIQSSRKPLLKIVGTDYQAYLYDAVNTKTYIKIMDNFIRNNMELKLKAGGLLIGSYSGLSNITTTKRLTDVSSNSITLVKKDEVVKTFRRLQAGVNPELELSLNLQQQTNFNKFPELKGYCTYRDKEGRDYSITLVEKFIENEGDGWAYTQNYLEEFLNYIWQEKGQRLEKLVEEYIQDYSQITANLGRTVAQLHLALASIGKHNFKPRAPKEEELRRWVIEVKTNFNRLAGHLQQKVEKLTAYQKLIDKLLNQEQKINKLVERIITLKEDLGKFIRCHGDLHLEQVLKRGEEFIILDFEGEPIKNITERRERYSPLKDLAGMLRSYNYAAYAAYFKFVKKLGLEADNKLLRAVKLWEEKVVEVFVENYLQEVRIEEEFLPLGDSFREAIELFKLEKALYEALYEVNNRSDWLLIPLEGIIDSLAELDKGGISDATFKGDDVN